MTRKTPEPHDAWERIQRTALRDEAERVAELSAAEIDAELSAAGFDPAAVRKRGADLVVRLERRAGTTAAKTARARPSRAGNRAMWLSVGLAAALAAVSGVALPDMVRRANTVARRLQPMGPLGSIQRPIPVRPAGSGEIENVQPMMGSAPRLTARQLRERGLAACRAGRFAECRSNLDEAREKDPASERDPAVRAARRVLRAHPAREIPDPL